MAKKRDRWEQMIIKHMNARESFAPVFHYNEVFKLLRTQHEAVVRMVKKEMALCHTNVDIGGDDGVAECWQARVAQCSDILSKLNEGAK